MSPMRYGWTRLVCQSGLLALLLSGCGQGKHSFLIVQACLLDERGTAAFIHEMKSIAAAEQMRFLDSSARTAEELRAVGYEGRERTHGSPVIHIGVERADGMGVTAANLGLPGYEVALGFSEGSSASDARDFADRVMARLETHWRLEVLPPGEGAKPKGNCP